MPLYGYRCLACGEEFEAFVLSPADKEQPQECPACGARDSRPAPAGRFCSRSGEAPPSGPACSRFG